MSYPVHLENDDGSMDNPFASPEGKMFPSGNNSSILEDSPYPLSSYYQTSASISTSTHGGAMESPRLTLREEAERQLQLHRQRGAREHPHYSATSTAPAAVTPTPPRAGSLVMRSTTSPHPLASAMKPRGQGSGGTGETNAAATEPSIVTPHGSNGDELVLSARKEWKRHGGALTQDLEETRRRDEDRPGTLTVRLVSAENRSDVTNRKYTAYVLRVRLPGSSQNQNVLQLEHRYSEFVKLRDAFERCDIHLDAPFPPKHLAGRVGNWQLARKWAPDQHEELVRYRKVQLDAWLVAVTARYNLGDMPHSLARLVYDFLTLSDRPPCDMENTVDDLSSRADGTSGSGGVLRRNNPISFTLGSSIRQACRIVETMCMPSRTGIKSDQSIPLDLLQSAKGLIFLTVIKAGFVVSGRIGTGLLIARVDGEDGARSNPQQKWSAPCALGTIGMGWGMLAGGDITHYLVVLTTEEAVEAVLSGGKVQLGTELGVAIGPVGRMSQVSASASNTEWALHPAYSYAHSKGLFAGMSIEGAVLGARNDVNAKFYGRSNLTPADLVLDGLMPPPKAAEPLYAALERALATEIPQKGFRPSQLFRESSWSSPGEDYNGSGDNGNPYRWSMSEAGTPSESGFDSYHPSPEDPHGRGGSLASNVPTPDFYRAY
ncbi:unnamed protein product [Pseudo-nitzschia multistriata]|uniref:PX domain-containing protein n=1 Tax=Pseudo-nitzschia multistriata TaxID=183589 RepID=A0A448YW14_9STRA|nr:unnamed protein product [Pseudo-nitzschia multistriata]